MKTKIKILLASLLVIICFTGCKKEEPSPLVGTSWECIEEPEILVFVDNNSGIYYFKGGSDGVRDEIYSSFKLNYSISDEIIWIKFYFPKYVGTYDYVMENEETLSCGRLHYKKIQHKVYCPE